MKSKNLNSKALHIPIADFGEIYLVDGNFFIEEYSSYSSSFMFPSEWLFLKS